MLHSDGKFFWEDVFKIAYRYARIILDQKYEKGSFCNLFYNDFKFQEWLEKMQWTKRNEIMLLCIWSKMFSSSQDSLLTLSKLVPIELHHTVHTIWYLIRSASTRCDIVVYLLFFKGPNWQRTSIYSPGPSYLVRRGSWHKFFSKYILYIVLDNIHIQRRYQICPSGGVFYWEISRIICLWWSCL